MLANTLHDTIAEILERLNGPLNFRLIVMPIVVSVLAIRAGLKDAREGRPTFMRGIFSRPAERSQILRSAMADIGKIFIVASILDTAYQIMTKRPFRVIEVLFVAVACAIVPYLMLRGPVTLLVRGRCQKPSTPASSKRELNDRIPSKPNTDQ